MDKWVVYSCIYLSTDVFRLSKKKYISNFKEVQCLFWCYIPPTRQLILVSVHHLPDNYLFIACSWSIEVFCTDLKLSRLWQCHVLATWYWPTHLNSLWLISLFCSMEIITDLRIKQINVCRAFNTKPGKWQVFKSLMVPWSCYGRDLHHRFLLMSYLQIKPPQTLSSFKMCF